LYLSASHHPVQQDARFNCTQRACEILTEATEELAATTCSAQDRLLLPECTSELIIPLADFYHGLKSHQLLESVMLLCTRLHQRAVSHGCFKPKCKGLIMRVSPWTLLLLSLTMLLHLCALYRPPNAYALLSALRNQHDGPLDDIRASRRPHDCSLCNDTMAFDLFAVRTCTAGNIWFWAYSGKDMTVPLMMMSAHSSSCSSERVRGVARRMVVVLLCQQPILLQWHADAPLETSAHMLTQGMT